MYKLVRTSRLYEQIVEQIEGSIVKGDLKAGDQLPAERDLAQRFGVSRTAVREAVKALREKGLVEAYSGRGTFITDGTTQAVRQSLDLMVKIGQPEGSTHLAEVRAILEPEIAALAAVRIQEPELTTMRDAVAAMDRAGQDPETYIEADLDFHLALAEGAANTADPAAYHCGLGIFIAACLVLFVEIKRHFDGVPPLALDDLLIDDFATLSIGLPVLGLFGIACLFVAAHEQGGAGYYAGLGGAIAAVLIGLASIKACFDRAERH